ncbi:DUF3108 domain-containing protein [Inhella gelatinilytica]|uniref:DUF3108 domain-containing protein n=1 Tax=Inhella gelatinilytica TaxID=2795030 RepID=A0A931IVQ8_9BURK|nr:hypothetical protein [Inhella gelatinilytica]MBH9551879.1 hypothetical protein [Inhella gelatinilytica]
MSPAAAVEPPEERTGRGLKALPPTAWEARYTLTMAGEEGVAILHWRPEGDRYTLSLERSLASRALPTWHSEGQLSAEGLQPLHFRAQRGPRPRERMTFLPEEGQAHFSALNATQPVAALTQDRLSWLVQLVALTQAAAPETTELPVTRVGWRGNTQQLVFRRQPPQAEDPPGTVLWRGELREGGGFEIEAWLDPQRGHWPRRLRQRFEGEPRSEWVLQAGPADLDPRAP